MTVDQLEVTTQGVRQSPTLVQQSSDPPNTFSGNSVHIYIAAVFF